ncbi:MAG: hypothetical protein QM778_27065 [Myxococcales bacterium]
MNALEVLFILSALNPFGGAFLAIPLAIFKLGWSPWFVWFITIPLIYAQVIVVDLLWDRLLAWPRAARFLEQRKSEKLERILGSKHSGLWLSVFGVWAGCWLVMAAARFAGYRQSKVAFPLLFGISYLVAIAVLICLYAPEWLPK